MFSTSRNEEGQPDQGALSAWPAVAAASFAWIIALLRLLVGRARQEHLDLDIALAAGSALLIPAVILMFWLSVRRRGPSTHFNARGRRPHLSLISSTPQPSRPIHSLRTRGQGRR